MPEVILPKLCCSLVSMVLYITVLLSIHGQVFESAGILGIFYCYCQSEKIYMCIYFCQEDARMVKVVCTCKPQ
jgi:hypothetical protein